VKAFILYSVYSVYRAIRVIKVKTSIYISKDLWEKFRVYASKRGIEVSRLLEDIIRDEVLEDSLDSILLELAGVDIYEVDFEPIEVSGGIISDLVRVMRDEQSGSIPR